MLHGISPAEKRRFWGLIMLNVFISMADIAALAVLLLVIQFYIQPAASSWPDVLPAWLNDRNSVALVTVFLLLFALKNLLGYWVNHAQYRFVYQVASRQSEKNLLQYLEGSFPDHVKTDSSVYIRRISQQPIEFCHYVVAGMQVIITQAVLVTLTVLAIILFNAGLFLLLLLILLPPIIVVAFLIKRKLHSVRMYSRASSEKSMQYLKESLAGYVESNIYDRHQFFKDRYSRYLKQFNRHLADLQIVQGIPGRMIEVFAVLGLVILVALNTGNKNHGMDLLTTGAFMAAAYKIIPGIVKILNAGGQARAYEFTIPALLPDTTTGEQGLKSLKTIQTIEFRKVHFSHGHQTILNDLSFSLSRGDFLGISGSSGSGKTTLINLLLGFQDPDRGTILFDENVTTSVSRKGFWTNISYVKQQPFLIHDTVLSNITLDDKNYDEQRLNDAIRLTGLDELTARSPEGVLKIIAENGKDISGGQRQRIAVARAIYKQAELIILDEPFNELDDAAEKKLLEHFRQISREGRMVILITHNQESFSICTKTISINEK